MDVPFVSVVVLVVSAIAPASLTTFSELGIEELSAIVPASLTAVLEFGDAEGELAIAQSH
ncbi:hypothetical protein [[Leptolyngbya] sp. PCC 7376]|uniref:hypothetical protein n=1 Tax=[Leptolyngbya] sp. PCC 7376 TaxID=111781 RepID=UPI0013588235|nr:hypothetical protein [[Leptolyngbya] sp. PCC 7376]